MNETLSNIVADLFARSQGSEEIASHINRLRAEINKGTERGEAIYGKFRGLLESFREVIPDEKQRYHAAIKALSTTSMLSQQDIIKAIGGQAEELKILEKSLLTPLPAWREELKAMEAKAKLKSDEIAKLREQMARLEAEEEGIRKGRAARERIMDLAEMAMKELFADIGTEIASLKKKTEELSAESVVVPPVVQSAPVTRDAPAADTGGGEQSVRPPSAPAPMETGLQKKCPMCGGIMNLHTVENTWMCYSCAYEEANTGPGPVKQAGGAVREPAAPQNPEGQKQCPMCGGKMDFLSNERMWQCYSCAYEEAEKDAAQERGAGISEQAAPRAVPVTDPSFNEDRQPKKKSAATKTKTCPSCKKKMYFYPDENAWRCPSCYYETRMLKS